MATKEKTKEELLQAVADTVTEKPATLNIDIRPKNKFHSWLIKHKISPSKRFFPIKPQRVGNIYRIAGRAVSFNVAGVLEANDPVGILMKLMHEHGDDIIYIVASVIQNDHREPTKKMLDIVKNEFVIDDLYTVLEVGLATYNVQSFLNSIVLITGVNALNIETSPVTNGG